MNERERGPKGVRGKLFDMKRDNFIFLETISCIFYVQADNEVTLNYVSLLINVLRVSRVT